MTKMYLHRVVEPPNAAADPAVAELETGVSKPDPRGTMFTNNT